MIQMKKKKTVLRKKNVINETEKYGNDKKKRYKGNDKNRDKEIHESE